MVHWCPNKSFRIAPDGAVFLDSSALVKFYVQEPGSTAVEELLLRAPGESILIAKVTGVEVVAAFKRTERMGALTSDQVDAVVDQFTALWRTECMVIEMDRTIVEAAMRLARRYGLRGYDAIQLACGLVVAQLAATRGDSFSLWSSDAELLSAALAEGLAVRNPAVMPVQ